MISRCGRASLVGQHTLFSRRKGKRWTHRLAVGDLGVELVRQDIEQVELNGGALLLVARRLLDLLDALEQELGRLLGEAGKLLEEELWGARGRVSVGHA